MKRAAHIEAYRACYAAAIDVQGLDSPSDALNSGAATILISWQKAGLV